MKKNVFTKVVVLLIEALCVAAGLEAQTAIPFPKLEADSQAYTYAQMEPVDGYSWQQLVELSLWASGAGASAPGSRQPSFAGILREAVEELRMSPGLPLYPQEKGAYVLAFMHKKFLKSYSERQTRIDTILSAGTYNCVSSAVLYMIFAVSIGLDVQGVMTRDHAFVTINTGSLSIDVETTNPYGFDPGNRREFHDNFGALTGFVYVPARNYRDRTSISQLELVSLILTNRISSLEARNRFNEAVPLALNRVALLSQRRNPVASPLFPDPQKDLTAHLRNFGTSLANAGKEQDALRWALLVETRYPDEDWQDFIYTLMNNLLVKLLQAQQVSEAWNLLNANASRLSPGNVTTFSLMILDTELVQRTAGIRTTSDVEAVLAILSDAKTVSILPAGRTMELRTFVLLKGGELLAAEEGWFAAINFIETAITRYGSNVQLESRLQAFRTNRVAQLHNAFVNLFNRRNYEGAHQFILEALEEFPGNRHLATDLELVEKVIKKK
ncbi:MAG: hypothetical protein LBT14_09615 [Treponema sp.]|nr:hypothetical protein [Treponema sp.]